jgi:3-(3-hydroxy-phenyl)propionate hydroxylase
MSSAIHGADENILNSTRSTDFITPKSEISRIFRDAVLDLSEHVCIQFRPPLVNSGRLSVPCTYDGSPLNTARRRTRRSGPISAQSFAPAGRYRCRNLSDAAGPACGCALDNT